MAVVSLPCLLATLSSILLTFGARFSRPLELGAGTMLALCSCAACAVIAAGTARFEILSRVRIPGKAAAWARAFTSVLLPCALAGAMGAYVARASAGGAGPETSIGPGARATVVSTLRRAYDTEAVLRVFTDNSGDRGVPALALITGDTGARAGDTIEIRRQSIALSDSRHGASPMFRAYLRRGIRHLYYLSETDISFPARANPGIRERAAVKISSVIDRLYAPRTAALIKGLYFGNKNYIDKMTLYRFKRAGVLHILAASGSHLAVIAAIPLAVFGLVRLDRRCILAVSVVAAGLYLCLTDMPISLQRAFIMFACFAVQYVFDFDRNPFNALFLSAIALAALHPHEIYSLGTHLTYGATFGILALYRPYRGALSPLPAVLKNPLALTLAAQAAVYPVLLVHLGEVNIASIATNIIVVPAVQLMLALSIPLNAAAAVLPFDLRVIGSAFDVLYSLVHTCVRFASDMHLHHQFDRLPSPLAACYALYLLPLLPLSAMKRAGGAILSVCFMLTLAVFRADAHPAGDPFEIITERSRMVMLTRRDITVATGYLGDASDTGRMIRHINNANPPHLCVCFSGVDFQRSRHMARLVKSTPVRECFLADGYRYGRYLETLLSVLDRDGVPLALVDSPGKGRAPESGRDGKQAVMDAVMEGYAAFNSMP